MYEIENWEKIQQFVWEKNAKEGFYVRNWHNCM